MKKNVAGQVVGVDMVALDGSPFTGATTVYVTGNNGTQAEGSVGSGAGSHKGNGFHTYAPSQAETNYDHVAFTFVGSGAVTKTVQLFTDFPQSGDAFGRLGAPAGASLATDLAAMRGAGFNSSTDSLEALRDRGDSAWTGGGTSLDAPTLRSWLGMAAANLDTVLGGISTGIGTLPNWTAISGAFSALQSHGDSNWAGGGSGGDSAATIAAAVRTELSLTGGLDAKFTTLATGANITSAQTAITNAISSSQTSVTNAIDGIEGGSVDTGELAAAVVDEWKAQSQADPTQFQVNVKEMNDAALLGNGTEANKWRGA